ncbi:MAG: M13-type metalloendopeptidase [Opitutaceae bacterium]|nr:M13-type metalloendopeptidase [Opitutaceae bacterium]
MLLRLLLATFSSTLALAASQLGSGIDRSNMDPSARPQDDLYLATNGDWLKRTEIPADKSNYGSFIAFDDLSRERQMAQTSPSQFRANGAPINADAFHEAFGTKPGDNLYRAPSERIRIW